MSSIWFLALAAVLCVVGLFVLWLSSRRPTSLQGGLDEFNREMRALAPTDGRQKARKRPEAHVRRIDADQDGPSAGSER